MVCVASYFCYVQECMICSLLFDIVVYVLDCLVCAGMYGLCGIARYSCVCPVCLVCARTWLNVFGMCVFLYLLVCLVLSACLVLLGMVRHVVCSGMCGIAW